MQKLFFFLVFLLPVQLMAQQKLTGMVLDDQGKPLNAATVVLLQNGQTVTSQLANMGKFELNNLNKSPYQLSVSLVGYKPALLTFSLPKDTLNVHLATDQLQLNEVQVTFKRRTIEQQKDRTVFNVENSILANGGSAWDALAKSPGVQANTDGTLNAGSKQATVYLDDKPVRLSGEDLTTYLQSIPSDNIAKIEVIPNPPSKYEAEGGAIINIVTKKLKSDGFNASLSGGYTRGNKNRYTSNMLFNYRKDKLNIYGNIGYSDINLQRNADQFAIYQTPTTYSYWDLKRIPITNRHGDSFTVGADYNISPKQVLGILVTGSHEATSGTSTGITQVFNNHNLQPDSTLNTNSRDKGMVNRYSYNLNYNLKLDSGGNSLNFDFDFVPYRKDNTQDLSSRTLLPDGSLASAPYSTSAPATQNVNIWSGKGDYAYHLGKLTMESGLKYTGIVSTDQLDFYNTASASLPQFDPARSNSFRYTENTSAAYTDVAGTFGKWSFKGGIRAEYTTTDGFSLSLDSTNKTRYLRIFPTAAINYKPSEKDEFEFTYSKRINRPDYWQLNPAKNYLTPYDYSSGNPFLKPAIIDNIELKYILHSDYTISAVYTQTNDLVSNVIIQDNVNKTYYNIQENIGTIKAWGTELTAVNNPAPWWEINNMGQLYYRSQSSNLPGYTYSYQQFYFYLRTDHSFTIDKSSGLKAELSAWYSSPQEQGKLRLDKTYDLSTGISKSIFNKQGTIRLSASDLLKGNTYNIRVDNNGQYEGIRYMNDTRVVSLSITYKFGKNVAAARKRATASEEEKRRAN